MAGIDLDHWDPSKGADVNRATIEAVYRYYGDVYLPTRTSSGPGWRT